MPQSATEKFELGDRVKWWSQAQGCGKWKVGIIVDIVPAGRYNLPNRDRFPKLAKECGMWRDHESYVIEVAHGAKGTLREHYWPVVSKLQREGN